MMTESIRISSMSQTADKRGRMTLSLDGIDLQMSFVPASGPADILLIGFNGAIDPKIRDVPAFVPEIPGADVYAHQLMISDPSQRFGGDLALAWYAGDFEIDTVSILRRVSEDAVKALGTTRTIYFGTSGGGFAALRQSWHDPGSLALIGNPQTNIATYHFEDKVRAYLDTCWPDCLDICDLPDRVTVDLLELYGEKMENTVIYLQNPTDFRHIKQQMAPFLAGLDDQCIKDRLVFESVWPGRTGRTGHVFAWAMFAPWLKAAAVAPSWSVEDLTQTRHRVSGVFSAAEADSPDTPGARFSDHDIKLARLLTDYQMRNHEGRPHVAPKKSLQDSARTRLLGLVRRAKALR